MPASAMKDDDGDDDAIEWLGSRSLAEVVYKSNDDPMQRA
jgi:hypothetical protein